MTEYRAPDLSLFGEEHVEQYRATDGEVGYEWNGVPTLLLTTTGRKSGLARTAPLIFGRDDDRCIVIASKGGWPDHPLWYLNLEADPLAEVQIKGERFSVRARTAEGEERERAWTIMSTLWPNYDEYMTRTTRVIPVVILERV